MLHPADLVTFAAHADAAALRAIEGTLSRFTHETLPHHADGLSLDALLLRAVIANATVSDEDEQADSGEVSAAA